MEDDVGALDFEEELLEFLHVLDDGEHGEDDLVSGRLRFRWWSRRCGRWRRAGAP